MLFFFVATKTLHPHTFTLHPSFGLCELEATGRSQAVKSYAQSNDEVLGYNSLVEEDLFVGSNTEAAIRGSM